MSALLDSVRAIRFHALGIVAATDGLLRAITPGEGSVIPGPCTHPESRRTLAPRMGAPDAWVCACGQEGE